MAIGQWFNEGAAAQGAGDHRGSCPYADEEARREWLSGFDEATTFVDGISTEVAKNLNPDAAEANVRASQP